MAELEPTGTPAGPDHTFTVPRFSVPVSQSGREDGEDNATTADTRRRARRRRHHAPTLRRGDHLSHDHGSSVRCWSQHRCATTGVTHRSRRAGGVGGVRGSNYRRFAAGQSVSLIGSWTQDIAQALLVWQVTHSPIMLGLVAAIRYVPVLIGTPYAGLIVDRHDRRHVLMLTSTVLGVTSLAMGAAVLTHVVAIWQAFLSAAVFGVMTSLDNPARMAFIPELVGAPLIRQAITTNSIMANVGRAVGPAVAAALVHFYGLGWFFVFNASAWSSSRCCG